MMLAKTRTLVRKAAMATSSVSASVSNPAAAASTAAATGRRTMAAVPSRRIPRAFRCSSHGITVGRGFSSLPTDDGNGGYTTDGETTTPAAASGASVESVEDGGGDSYADVDDDAAAASTSTVAADENDHSNANTNELNKNLKPSEIVEALDRHIVGQPDAKKSVAIAMRNRWRRRQLPEDLRKEVTPRNVLLVGPTG